MRLKRRRSKRGRGDEMLEVERVVVDDSSEESEESEEE